MRVQNPFSQQIASPDKEAVRIKVEKDDRCHNSSPGDTVILLSDDEDAEEVVCLDVDDEVPVADKAEKSKEREPAVSMERYVSRTVTTVDVGTQNTVFTEDKSTQNIVLLKDKSTQNDIVMSEKWTQTYLDDFSSDEELSNSDLSSTYSQNDNEVINDIYMAAENESNEESTVTCNDGPTNSNPSTNQQNNDQPEIIETNYFNNQIESFNYMRSTFNNYQNSFHERTRQFGMFRPQPYPNPHNNFNRNQNNFTGNGHQSNFDIEVNRRVQFLVRQYETRLFHGFMRFMNFVSYNFFMRNMRNPNNRNFNNRNFNSNNSNNFNAMNSNNFHSSNNSNFHNRNNSNFHNNNFNNNRS